MQKLGIGPRFVTQECVEASYDLPSPSALWDQLAPTDFVLDSTHELRPVRSLSIYSTESAYSTDSGGTTISDIVELYTDLVGKISSDEILQPRAYRDTIAPLLQRQFSSMKSTSSLASIATVPSVPMSLFSQKPSQASLCPDSQQAPTFQEFSQALRDRRKELVSPLSAFSSETFGQMTIGSVSEPSPTSTPQTRPFSFHEGPEVIGDIYFEIREITPPLSDSDQAGDLKKLIQTHPAACATSLPSPDRSGAMPRHASDVQLSQGLSSDAHCHQRDPQYHKAELHRYYQDMSTKSDSAKSFVMHSGVGETVKAMIQEKLNRRREAKDRAKIVSAAAQKYPSMEAEQRNFRNLARQQRRSSLKEDMSHALQRLSWTNSGTDYAGPPGHKLLRRREKPAAIPLTPYQQYGAEIWYSDDRKKREARRREKEEARQMEEAKSRPPDQPRPPLMAGGSNHRRKSPSRSTTEASSAHSKRNTLKAALEGARNSLTQSSADKRREKLKDSIMIVGPTELTIANAATTTRSN